MNKYGRFVCWLGVCLVMLGVGIVVMLVVCFVFESIQQECDVLVCFLIEQKKIIEDVIFIVIIVDGYKVDLVKCILQVNFISVYVECLQVLLCLVIVIKYVVDGDGNLVKSEILCSNCDKYVEVSVLGSLKLVVFFFKLLLVLFKQGCIELLESWLFNNDGCFQLCSVVLVQMDCQWQFC